MNSSRQELRSSKVLLVGGAIAAASVSGQLISLLLESDLATPTGRFRTMAVAVERFAPLLGASVLLVAGSQAERRGTRWLVGAYLLLMAILCIATIPSLLPDARQLASGVRVNEVSRFRGQVARAFLYLVVTAGLFSFASWRLLRGTPLTRPAPST